MTQDAIARASLTDRTATAAGPAVALVAAGVLGGLLHALKGAVLVSGGPDLSLVPAMLLLFSLGMLALHQVVAGRGRWARVGSAAAWAGVAFGVASLACQAVGWQPEDAADPVVADVAYAGGTLSILIGLLALGVAWAQEWSILSPWRWVPLVVAVIWFPLEGLTALTPEGWGMLLAGIAWVAAAVAPALARRSPGPA